jgi:hypothetical protein
MDLITIIIIASVFLSIVGGVFWFIFIVILVRAVVKGIASNMKEFQAMDVTGMYRTLLHLQQSGQIQFGQQYMNSLGEGPITSQIHGCQRRNFTRLLDTCRLIS